MIIAKYGHDHALRRHDGHVSWRGRHDSYHDHGMIIMFSIFFLKKKMEYLSMFSQIFAAIYHYMAHLTGFRRIYASKSSWIWRRKFV